MANLSNCRFENTASDLDDCTEAVEDILAGEGEPLSVDEFRGARSLIQSSIRMLGRLLEEADMDWDDLNRTDIETKLANLLAQN